jgi:integrase
MMKNINITVSSDARVQQWLGLIDAEKATRMTYTTYISAFCECVGKTPTQLIEESIMETKEGKLLSERNTVIYITKFKKWLIESGKAPTTQGVALTSVQSFYRTFDIQLSSVLGRRKKRLPLRENQNFISKDDVNNLITNSKNLRTKAMILCMATSGMAKNEILNLRMRDITFENIGEDSEIGIIPIRRQKTQTDYTTFISPEAVLALRDYIAERNRNINLKVKGSNDFVFVTYGEKLNEGQTKGSGRGSKISPHTFTNEFKKMGEDLGYGNGFFVKTRSHSLRKFFASTLENAGIPKNKIDFMLGHSVNGSDLAYFRTEIGKLKQLYIDHLPYITFDKEIVIRSLNSNDAKELNELKKENLNLNAKITEIEKQKGKEIESIKLDNEEFKKTVREDFVRTLKLLHIGDFDSIAIDNLRVVKKARQLAKSSKS